VHEKEDTGNETQTVYDFVADNSFRFI